MLLVTLGLILLAACTTTPTDEPALLVATSSTASPEPTAEPTATDLPVPEPMVLIDGLGTEITLEEPAQRIVSLAASNTEILFALGAQGQIVGREDTADYPPEAIEITSIGSLFGDINTEAIVALEPDLALAAGTISPEQVQAIEDVGIPVFYLSNPMSFEELFEDIRTVGILAGRQEEAAALVDELSTRVEAVMDKLTGVDPVKVFYEIDGTDPSSPWTTGEGTFQDVLIGIAGGENIAADIVGWGQMNLEELVARDPAVIIFGEGPWVPTTPESLSERTGWGEITAVVNGDVYGIDTNWVDRPGPRLVDAFETFARLLHPELFK
jgi:iron complex transport system substrate-binding protein